MNRKMIAREWLIVLVTCFACVPLVAFAAGSPDDDAKAVQGNWKPAIAELAGQPMSDAVLKSISLKLDNGKYEGRFLRMNKTPNHALAANPAISPLL